MGVALASTLDKCFGFLRSFLNSDLGLAFTITITWKLFMLTVGYIIDLRLSDIQPTLLHHTINWDSNWYLAIISDHYITNIASAVFYPLFPLLVGILHFVSFNTIDPPLAGQIINTISVWFIVVALLKLGRKFLEQNKRIWLVAFVLSAPAAFFLHVFYGEAVFMALGLWGYVFALKRRWLSMGILLGFLTAARLPALLFVGLCGLEFMRTYDWNMRKILNRKLLYFLIAPLGFVAYGLYLLLTRGEFLGMFHAYSAVSDWSYQVFNINIIKTMLHVSYHIFQTLIELRQLTLDIIVNHLLPMLSLFTLGICSLYLAFKKRGKYLPLGIFGFVAIIMFTLNSNVVSVHRYVLPCLTIPIALALAIKGRYQLVGLFGICLGSIAIQLFLFFLFINNMFAG